MAPGTLNVSINTDYIVIPDAVITGQEYFTGETLKLQRCRVRGHRMIIMRPDSHERVKDGARVLELVSPINLRATWGLVNDNIIEVEVEGDDAWWNAPEGPAP
jgi:CTP-dependent riboflavin kinase